MTDTSGLIERGLTAWTQGDLDALEPILDSGVTLHAVEPGPWDCLDRDSVMRLLRQRQTDGSGGDPVRIERVDERTFTVKSGPDEAVATRVTVENGKVVAMQQFRVG
jgi:hypothetical protein